MVLNLGHLHGEETISLKKTKNRTKQKYPSSPTLLSPGLPQVISSSVPKALKKCFKQKSLYCFHFCFFVFVFVFILHANSGKIFETFC